MDIFGKIFERGFKKEVLNKLEQYKEQRKVLWKILKLIKPVKGNNA